MPSSGSSLQNFYINSLFLGHCPHSLTQRPFNFFSFILGNKHFFLLCRVTIRIFCMSWLWWPCPQDVLWPRAWLGVSRRSPCPGTEVQTEEWEGCSLYSLLSESIREPLQCKPSTPRRSEARGWLTYLLISCQTKASVSVRFPSFRSCPAMPTRENLAWFFPSSTA